MIVDSHSKNLSQNLSAYASTNIIDKTDGR